MNDIETKEDIVLIVDTFYDRVNKDSILGPIFNERANVDWDEHKKKLYLFWNSIVFQSGEYKGQPFLPHFNNMPLYRNEFDHWLTLFTSIVDQLFKGVNANKMKKSGQNIANVLMIKLGIIEHDILNTIE